MRYEHWCDQGVALAAAQFLQEESGQNLIEYGLIAGVIGLGAIAASSSLKNSIAALFSAVGSQLAAIS